MIVVNLHPLTISSASKNIMVRINGNASYYEEKYAIW
jgi:hypothetical protein